MRNKSCCTSLAGLAIEPQSGTGTSLYSSCSYPPLPLVTTAFIVRLHPERTIIRLELLSPIPDTLNKVFINWEIYG